MATTFDFEFKVFAKTDIAVVLADEIGTETTLVLDSDYSVALNADQNADPGGTITYPISGSPPATGEVLAIVGGLAYSQTTQLPNGGAYNASVVERALDRITILVQQILETATRGVQLAVTAATDVSSRLPAPVANFLVAWNPTATALVNVDPAVVQGSQAFASWIVDTFDGTGTVGGEYVLTGNAAGIGNLDVSVAGIAQRAGIDFTFYNNVVTSVASWPVGTDNVLIRYGEAVSVADVPVESSMITDSTAVGRAVLTAADAAAARTAIGAGTGTAMAGGNTDITSLGNNTSTIYTTAGTSTAYTITPTPAITAYAIGQSHVVNFNAASGASPTLQISGIATPPNLVKQLPDGAYGNIGANDIQTGHRSRVTLISATQALVEELNPLTSMVKVRTPPAGAAGYGTTSTRYRRFTTVDVNQGSGFTYADSVTLGGLITTTEPGTWAISYTDQFAAGDYLSITLNDTVPTGVPLAAEILASDSIAGANVSASCSWTGYLPSGSLLRARTQNGTSSGTQTQYGQFTMVKVG